jgi:putative membrane protein
LSSTSSDQNPKTRSATESLASRYRHLFVLPSSPQLLLYGGVASLLVSVLSRSVSGLLFFIPTFAVFLLSATAISSALKIIDEKTLADFRRTQAVLLAGDILWMVVAAVGAAYGWATGSPNPLTNALLFGAFACAGLEFIIINGAFIRNGGISFILAVLQPASTLLLVRFPELRDHLDLPAASCGIVALGLFLIFPALLKRKRTSRGYDALSLFQAFMKTWAAGYSDDLEGAIADHSEEIEVTTKVLRFRTRSGDTFLVLPGVHPGPFHPVGSYDLPGVVSRAFADLGPVMTLHMPGGHERNLATRGETSKYAAGICELARSIAPDGGGTLIRGPIHAKVGNANVSASAFSEDVIMTISFAPLGSDDLDIQVETDLASKASKMGFELSVVDAHNSIDHNLESPTTDDPEWNQLFEEVSKSKAESFGAAYSHSNEVGFTGKGDLTENGIGLFMVQTVGGKSVLILADANNSVPALRGEVMKSLGAAGYRLIEFCTSDSHNLAARGLTVERGYQALGEATPIDSITDLAVKLARIAETRLAPATYGSGEAKANVKVFGSRALEEFAAITQSSSNFSRRFLKFALVIFTALLFVSVVV